MHGIASGLSLIPRNAVNMHTHMHFLIANLALEQVDHVFAQVHVITVFFPSLAGLAYI